MFACVFARATRNAPQSFATPQALLSALTPFDQADVQGEWSDERMLMVQALTWNTPESRHEALPERCAETGRIIISWVRLDNRDALCDAMRLEPLPTLTDPQIILHAHRHWGANCVDRLEGDFSFVIYNPETAEVFCARDCIGAKPLYYYADPQVFVAATTAAVFRSIKQVSISPSRAWMARFMAGTPQDMTDSAFEGVARLSPGHHMQVRQTRSPVPVEYYKFQDLAPSADHRDPSYVGAYRTAFHQATHARLRSDFLVGAESSGGLDSSSIVAHAAKHLPHDITKFHCFGMYNLEDEPKYLLQTAIHCGLRHSHISTHTQQFEDPAVGQRALRILGYPPEHPQAQWYAPVLKQCEQLGIRTLLSGYGGDQIVTNPAGALQRELLHNRQYGALFRDMPGNLISRALRYGVRVRRMANAPPASIARNLAIVRRHLQSSLLRDDVVEEFDLYGATAARFRRQSETTSLNDFLLHDPIFSPRRVARLEACTLTAASHRIEYRWPLFDRRLLEQYLRTPAIEKRNGNMGRYLHRRAVEGSIPDMITWKQSKDLGPIVSDLAAFKIPDRMIREAAPSVLHSILDFDKIEECHAAAVKAQNTHQLERGFIRQMATLWSAAQLADWVG